MPDVKAICLSGPVGGRALVRAVTHTGHGSPNGADNMVISCIKIFGGLRGTLTVCTNDTSRSRAPVGSGRSLIGTLKRILGRTQAFARSLNISARSVVIISTLSHLDLVTETIRILITPSSQQERFYGLTDTIAGTCGTLLPSRHTTPCLGRITILRVLTSTIGTGLKPISVSTVRTGVTRLLSRGLRNITVLAPVIRNTKTRKHISLSGVSFSGLIGLFRADPGITTRHIQRRTRGGIGGVTRTGPAHISLIKELRGLITRCGTKSVSARGFFRTLGRFVTNLSRRRRHTSHRELARRRLTVFSVLAAPRPGLAGARRTRMGHITETLLTGLHRLVSKIS